jgi:hypothetical protein
MNNKIVKRGYVPTDLIEFNDESIILLKKAQKDIIYLMENGYPIKSSSTFVGNHYLLSERQRLAIVRATSTNDIILERKKKCINDNITSQKLLIDGLNLIITLEVALSNSTLIKCMDGTVRDLAGLRGTYRLIDKTEQAIQLIGEKLLELKIDEVIFYLDSPVSNTGRLKLLILEILSKYSYKVSVELVNNADVLLENQNNVVTTDAIILNRCESWFNMAYMIIDENLPNVCLIDLS